MSRRQLEAAAEPELKWPHIFDLPDDRPVVPALDPLAVDIPKDRTPRQTGEPRGLACASRAGPYRLDHRDLR